MFVLTLLLSLSTAWAEPTCGGLGTQGTAWCAAIVSGKPADCSPAKEPYESWCEAWVGKRTTPCSDRLGASWHRICTTLASKSPQIRYCRSDSVSTRDVPFCLSLLTSTDSCSKSSDAAVCRDLRKAMARGDEVRAYRARPEYDLDKTVEALEDRSRVTVSSGDRTVRTSAGAVDAAVDDVLAELEDEARSREARATQIQAATTAMELMKQHRAFVTDSLGAYGRTHEAFAERFCDTEDDIERRSTLRDYVAGLTALAQVGGFRDGDIKALVDEANHYADELSALSSEGDAPLSDPIIVAIACDRAGRRLLDRLNVLRASDTFLDYLETALEEGRIH